MREINGNSFHSATVKTEHADHEEQVGRKKMNKKKPKLFISRVQREDKCKTKAAWFWYDGNLAENKLLNLQNSVNRVQLQQTLLGSDWFSRKYIPTRQSWRWQTAGDAVAR